jgi:glutamine synthetase
VALKTQIAKANKLGMYMKSGVECEYFLVSSDGTALSDPKDTQEKPCYDSSALMRRYDVITEICDSMISMGWKPYQNDHEDANGQFEMNWDFSDCLQTADRHAFFKFMTKTIAEKHGLRATFMPKPFTNLTGNGCHSHISVWDKTGKKNLFLDKKDELGLSKTGYHFLGGIVNSADKMAAIFNPTVNSYKRINGSVTLSGATWSPSSITWAGNNRTHMVRVPGPGRFELRLMDGASNPYLLQAGSLMLGLDGVMNKRDPGKRLDINMYTEGHKAGKVKKLPLNLLDSIRIFDSSKVIREGFGNQFVDSYVKLKNKEWESYSRDLSQWERNTTLDC